jgi:hypothetical protein
MSCCKTYDPCLDNKINQIGSYASTARQAAESAQASEEQVQADFVNISALTQAFNQKYLGAFASAPTEPPTIPEGALYWNTSSDFFYAWNGSAWINVQLGLITNAQVDVAAAIAYSKLALANSIVNADINTAAAINASKLAIGTARQLLQTNAGATSAEWASNIDVPGTLDVTGATVLDSSLTVSGNALINGVGALGYATGSGGTVTQSTSRTTGVTINKTNGAIVLFSDAGSGAYQTFTVTNSTVAATDVVIVSQKSGTDPYKIFVTNVSASSFNITFATASGTTTEQPVFNFAVIKAVVA